MLLVSFTLENLFFKEDIFDKWCVIISCYFKKFHLIIVHFHQVLYKHLKLYGYENYTAWMGQTWVRGCSQTKQSKNKPIYLCSEPLQFPLFFIFSLPKRVSIILVFCFFLHFHFTVQTNLISGNSPQKLIIQTFSFLMI